jgi:hypothetical protein
MILDSSVFEELDRNSLLEVNGGYVGTSGEYLRDSDVYNRANQHYRDSVDNGTRSAGSIYGYLSNGGGRANTTGDSGNTYWAASSGPPTSEDLEADRDFNEQLQNEEKPWESKPYDEVLDGDVNIVFGHALTDEEILFIIANPLDALTIKANSEIADELYDGYQDISDAKRHALWSAMNARDVGLDDAITFGYAHEDYEGNSDGWMDIANNQIGFEIATNNPYATNEELIQIVEQYAADGLLTTIK